MVACVVVIINMPFGGDDLHLCVWPVYVGNQETPSTSCCCFITQLVDAGRIPLRAKCMQQWLMLGLYEGCTQYSCSLLPASSMLKLSEHAN
jgi:hypothetical protein